jgi:16S rRNA (cytosine1402-N4)-methyltransferase
MDKVTHIPVLLNESIDLLDIKSTDTVFDGTFGGGGHSMAIFQKIKDEGILICNDLDENAKVRFENIFKDSLEKKNLFFTHFNFKDASRILESLKLESVDKVLLDLGTSTFQLLEDSRGFSFNSDTPLRMTFSQNGSHTGIDAHTIVNTWQESSIADIIYSYGGDRNSRKIARAIVESRENIEIKTSKQLADIISKIIPKYSKTHPATKTFQALRIAVNDEMGTLKEAMENWWSVLKKDGRLAIITFHSLEDKLVKTWMKNKTDERVITKKPIAPSRTEQKNNPKSRSAKLRVLQKIT